MTTDIASRKCTPAFRVRETCNFCRRGTIYSRRLATHLRTRQKQLQASFEHELSLIVAIYSSVEKLKFILQLAQNEKSVPGDASIEIDKVRPRHLDCIQVRVQYRYEAGNNAKLLGDD